VARQLGVGVASLRTWVNRFEIDDGIHAGACTEHDELVEVRKEVRELPFQRCR
jgi:transposase-like protein